MGHVDCINCWSHHVLSRSQKVVIRCGITTACLMWNIWFGLVVPCYMWETEWFLKLKVNYCVVQDYNLFCFAYLLVVKLPVWIVA